MRPSVLIASLLLAASIWAKEGFHQVLPEKSGVTFANLLAEQRHLTNQILLNGSGVAAGDIDNDGLCDLYFTRLDGPNALYRNRGGWRFEEIAAQAGVALTNAISTGCALADLEGDGDLDLIVNSLGQGTRIFFNDGAGRFLPLPEVLNPGKGGMSVSLGDLDGDGWLDLYLANYRTIGLMDTPNVTANIKHLDGRMMVESLNGRLTTAPDLTNRFSVGPRGALEEHGEADAIYRSVRGTNFVRVSWTGGNFLDENGTPIRSEPYDWGLAALIRDFTGDGLPDIYVCNDFQTPDRVWINQGQGRFRLIAEQALRKTSMFSMAADAADLDRDGLDDLFVADMMSRSHSQRMRETMDPPTESLSRPQYSLNTLFLNRGDETFAEIARFSGLQASEWSWSCIFVDVDLDGYEDLLISNGMERAARDLDMAARLKAMRAVKRMSAAEVFAARRGFPRLATRNLAFRNRGDLTFEEHGAAWGFDLAGISHGMALADLDNDGDLDLALNNLNAPATLYRNEADAPRVAVRLQGATPNVRGIGARIVAKGGPAPVQSQVMIGGGRYLSSDDPVRAFAAGPSGLDFEVWWPSGRRSEARGVKGPVVTLREPDSQPIPARPEPEREQLFFEDASARIPFRHADADFDDFARQPLLPRKLSQAGPGVAWYDFDRDGWDDLAIGNGRGGRIAVFRNNRNGEFEPFEAPALHQPLARDGAALLGWRGAPGRGFLLAAMSNYEDGQAQGAALVQYDLAGGAAGDIVSAGASSAGPVALADVDGDGDLDLFLAGSVVPGRYPAPASSRIFRNEGGKLLADTINENVLDRIGLVNGAVFSDFDGDGDPDLALATDWGPVRLLVNDGGRFTDATARVGLAGFTGWWTGIVAGDFDGDGRMDLAAGNWGLNVFPKPASGHPLKLWHGDFDGDGSYDLIETYYDDELAAWVPARQWPALAKSLGFVRQSFVSNFQYSTSSVARVLGDRIEKARVAEAGWLSSTVFLNRGGRFDARPLPAEAQFSPVFGLTAGDFDGDGHEDLALAQNFFAVRPEEPRQDGGRGLVLRGDGKGGFAPLGRLSGIAVYGEQRGLAAADFDHDGRLDIAIAENGGAAHLFRNLTARPGVRVSLEGAPSNPDAIGARLRFRSGTRVGPVREVQSSSGWLSQNSHTLIFAAPGAGEIEVRWPDGLQETIGLPAGVKQVRLRREEKN